VILADIILIDDDDNDKMSIKSESVKSFDSRRGKTQKNGMILLNLYTRNRN
jgi:hypothetical protein